MQDEQRLLEIIELNFDRVDKGYPYKIYKVSLRQSVRLSEGMVHIKLMTLDLDTAQYTVSNDIPVYLTTQHYNLTRQVYLAEELGSKVQGYYEKIVTLFEQLINEKGENINESNNYS